MCGTPFECHDTSVDPQSLCQHEALDTLDLDAFPGSGLVPPAQQKSVIMQGELKHVAQRGRASYSAMGSPYQRDCRVLHAVRCHAGQCRCRFVVLKFEPVAVALASAQVLPGGPLHWHLSGR